jgi:hypothetical protein
VSATHRRIIYIVFPLFLAACSAEPSQEMGKSNSRSDTASFQGTGKAPPFTAAGWKNGDKGAWEQGLKVRTQMGQNEYNKVP